MRLLYIADGRSPTALNWMTYFVRSRHEVHLASTFPCQPIEGLASTTIIPVALSGIYGQSDIRAGGRGSFIRKVIPVALRTQVRQLIAPLSFTRAVNVLEDIIERIQPDLIHAMRIPYEGMIAFQAIKRIKAKQAKEKNLPLLISVWGNDFTLHARSTPKMLSYTRLTLQMADGLHTDCQRDQRLAVELGYEATKPRIVLPGGGGIQMDVFYPAQKEGMDDGSQSITVEKRLTVINPRGFRAYVRNDTFFHAIPMVLRKFPEAHFLCPGMAGEAEAQKWVTDLGIGKNVELLPPQTRPQMAENFRQSQITLSITTHDGTPNTLLEAMACGCFPIAGDIESLREWIAPGVNGLLVDPGDPKALAGAILKAVSQPELRREAREKNLQLVKERAEYGKVMGEVEEFYKRLISDK
jgi:glycosyltransferase involved in cell wall biosynthesis